MHANSLCGDPAVAQPGGSGQRPFSDRPALVVGFQPADSGRPPPAQQRAAAKKRTREGRRGNTGPSLKRREWTAGSLTVSELPEPRGPPEPHQREPEPGPRLRREPGREQRLQPERGPHPQPGREPLLRPASLRRARPQREPHPRPEPRQPPPRDPEEAVPCQAEPRSDSPARYHRRNPRQRTQRPTPPTTDSNPSSNHPFVKMEFPEARSTQPREERCFTSYRSQTEPFYSRRPQES